VSIPFDQLTTLEASDAVSEHQAHDSADTSTPIIVISLLVSMSLGTAALADPVSSAGAAAPKPAAFPVNRLAFRFATDA
jgi:hypothetical protein